MSCKMDGSRVYSYPLTRSPKGSSSVLAVFTVLAKHMGWQPIFSLLARLLKMRQWDLEMLKLLSGSYVTHGTYEPQK